MTGTPQVVVLDGQEYQGGGAFVDVVVVPGYAPATLWRWLKGTGVDPSNDWIRTFLAERLGEFKEVRFLVYDYDASSYFRANIIQTGKVGECGFMLKYALDSMRLGQEKRPIIFLCHGLGVNMVNEALNDPELAEVTQAVLLLHHPADDGSPGPHESVINTEYIGKVPPGGPRVKVFTEFQVQGQNYVIDTKASGSASTVISACSYRTVREEILKVVKELKPPEPPGNYAPSAPPVSNAPKAPQSEIPQPETPRPEIPPPPYYDQSPGHDDYGWPSRRPDQQSPWGQGYPWPSFSGGTHVMPDQQMPWGRGYGPAFYGGVRVSPSGGSQPLPSGTPPPAPPSTHGSSGLHHHRKCTCQDCNASRHQAGLDWVAGRDHRRPAEDESDAGHLAGLAWKQHKRSSQPPHRGDPPATHSQRGPRHQGGSWAHSWGGGSGDFRGHSYGSHYQLDEAEFPRCPRDFFK